MRRRRILSSIIKYALVALAIGVFLLMTVAPLLEALLPRNEPLSTSLEWTRSRVMESMIAIWFFALGSMVGSFINVVVWRMPRGVSVVSKGSACPNCRQKIRLQDNIPIFGWIKLGGRCRICKLPISPRYPIVEAIFGVVFLLLFFVQLQTAGANLPGGSPYKTTGILQLILGTKWDMVATYAWHLVMFVMLITWALMAYDGSRIPIKTVVFTVAVGAIAPLLLPYLQPAQWIENHETWFADFPLLQNVVTGFLGIAAGFMVGCLLEMLFDERRSIGLSIGAATIGLFLGWQAVLMIVGLFGVCCLLLQRPTRSNQWPPMASLALAAFVHHLFWKQFHEPNQNAWWFELIALVTGFALAFIVSRLPLIERVNQVETSGQPMTSNATTSPELESEGIDADIINNGQSNDE